MTDILKERGWFWWGDEKLPDEAIAPANFIAGTLTIDEDGRTEIELDGELPTPNPPFSDRHGKSIDPSQTIAGVLKSDNQHILACDLHRSAFRLSSNGISFERYSAQLCLVSSERLPKSLKFRALNISLNGFEEWLRLSRSTHRMTSRSAYIRYKTQSDIQYFAPIGSMGISQNTLLTLNGLLGSRGSEIKDVFSFKFKPKNLMDLITTINTYISIQDFFLIITGSSYQFDWPSGYFSKNKTCKIYFPTSRKSLNPPGAHECITSFPQIRNEFGNIFFSWLAKRSELGPGIYLYTSTKRGKRNYEESIFTSLVSGLEALHRSLFADRSSKTERKRLERIINEVKSDKDRKWLEKKTKHFGLLNLEQRLREIFKSVSFNITPDKLNEFCKTCQDIRNEMLHHGMSKKLDSSENYLQSLNEISGTLSYLYHARIMIEIGVPAPIVERWLTYSGDSHRINWHMERVGLRTTDKKKFPNLAKSPFPTSPIME